LWRFRKPGIFRFKEEGRLTRNKTNDANFAFSPEISNGYATVLDLRISILKLG